MKLAVKLFLLIILPGSFVSLSQEHILFESVGDALSVPADSVYRLDLSRERLKKLPDEIYHFKNLRELRLNKNKLETLPDTFYFAHLEILDLSKNKLKEFPSALCGHKNLKQLFMGKNKMEEIPECIGEMERLQILDIWFNRITELPESLVELRKLRSLDMRGMNYSNEFQQKWKRQMPWVDFEFNLGCDCGY